MFSWQLFSRSGVYDGLSKNDPTTINFINAMGTINWSKTVNDTATVKSTEDIFNSSLVLEIVTIRYNHLSSDEERAEIVRNSFTIEGV